MTLSCQHGQLARSCPMCEYESMIATLEQENRQMRARMERLEKDAARYEWLREQGVWLDPEKYAKARRVLDAAIDAARATGQVRRHKK